MMFVCPDCVPFVSPCLLFDQSVGAFVFDHLLLKYRNVYPTCDYSNIATFTKPVITLSVCDYLTQP